MPGSFFAMRWVLCIDMKTTKLNGIFFDRFRFRAE